jgi:hypothetical protein
MAEREETFPKPLQAWKSAGLVVGIIGIVAAAVLGVTNSQRFLHGYMFAYIFWLALTMGCFGLTMVQHMVRSSWGAAILRFLEAGTANLWLMALLSIPVVYAAWTGQNVLFPWADHALVESNHHLHGKAFFLNPTFFTIRMVIYFGIWLLWATKLRRWSLEEDRTHSRAVNQARVNWSAPGIVMFAVTLTFAFTDLVMSLDPLWFSTIWGIWWMVCCGLAGSAFVVFMLSRVTEVKPYSDIVTPGLFRDLGNILLTFTMFWGYISLSQWLIIYSGNLPEEITYYIQRGLGATAPVGAWWILGVVIAFGQFFVPFLLLLSGRTKRTPAILGKVALWILVVRFLDVFWTVVPFFRISEHKPNLITLGIAVAAFLAIGGIWIFLWVTHLSKAKLMPEHNMFAKDTDTLEAQHAH